MKPKHRVFVVPVLVILVLAVAAMACSIDLGLPTQAPPQVITVVVPPSEAPATPLPAPSDTSRPSDTPVPPSPVPPTATPTLTPLTFTASELSNCRSGPSRVYPALEGIDNGQTVPIVGKSDNSWADLWWVVRVDNVECWVWASLGTTTGDTSQVAARVAPPTPVPTPTPKLVTFYIKNNHAETIWYVFIRVHGASSWGDDRMGSDTIAPGSKYYFKLPVGYYDFRFENAADNVIDTADNVHITTDTAGFTSP